MAFNKLTENVSILSTLDRTPNATSGYDYRQMQAYFDAAPEIIKAFVNDLIDALAAATAAANIGTAPFEGVNADNLQAALEKLQQNINGISVGALPDGSVTGAKLASDGVNGVGANNINDKAVKTAKLENGAVTNEKIAPGTIQGDRLDDSAVNGAKLAAGAVESRHFSAEARQFFYNSEDGLPDNSVDTANLKDGAVKGAKLDLASGNLGDMKLTSGTHYFSSLSAVPERLKQAGMLVFVKASD